MEIKRGSLVTCDDLAGFWKVLHVHHGKAFPDHIYADIVLLMDENYRIPEKERTYVCIISLLKAYPLTRLIETSSEYMLRLNSITKIISEYE